MAIAKRSPRQRRGAVRRRSWGVALVAVLLALALGYWLWGERIAGLAAAGSAYGAKTACSCRFLAGRELDSCRRDFLPGMEMVLLSEDEEARSVTARVPLFASTTATYREGFGCVLEPQG